MSVASIPAASFVPAWDCADAVLTLRWERLHGAVYGWQLRYQGRIVDNLVGYPTGTPAVTAEAARTWADTVTGPQVWIEKPARSGAFHTHPQATS